MSYRPPFYKRFPRDYRTSSTTRKMRLADHGVYNILLDASWEEESTATIPADLALLSKITGIDKRILRRFFVNYPKTFRQFPDDSQRLFNPRLRAEFEQFQKHCEKKRLAGIESGKARQSKRTPAQQALNNSDSDLDTEAEKSNSKAGAAARQQPPPVFEHPQFSVNHSQDRKLSEVYPWVDRSQEYGKMGLWLEANRPGQKIRRSLAFCQNWFNKIPCPAKPQVPEWKQRQVDESQQWVEAINHFQEYGKKHGIQ